MSTTMTAELLSVRGLDDDTRLAWRALEEAAVEPNPFFGPDMAGAAADHLPGGCEDQLLVVRQGSELELALPVRRVRRYRRVPIETFRAWGHDQTFLDTPLVRDRDPEGAWDAALRCLRSRGAGWLTFERLAADGPVRAALELSLRRRGARATRLIARDRPVVRRRPTATYLEGRMSSSQRRRLGRFRRRLEAELGGPVRVVDRAADDLTCALERFLALEQGGWKGESGTALASMPGGADFFRGAMAAAARDGRAQLWELGVGDTVVAALSAVVGGDGSFHLKTAYDEQFRSCSPGVQLEVAVLEAFHDDESLGWIDSGVTGVAATPSSLLYPDTRSVECLVVPLRRGAAQLAAAGLRRGVAWEVARATATG